MKKQDSVAEERISKDQYFLKMADVVAERSTCLRKKIGSVLVKDGMVLSTGYNGAPKGLPHCTDENCIVENGHCVRTIHSEVNAILQAAYHGVATEGASLYTQFLPCPNCSKVLINSGVKKIIFTGCYGAYDNNFTKRLLRKAKVSVLELKNESRENSINRATKNS